MVISMPPDASTARKAWSDYALVAALGGNQRFAEACQAAVDLEARYNLTDDLEVRFVCALSLVSASAISTAAGDRGRGMALLDTVESRYPGMWQEHIAIYRGQGSNTEATGQ